MGAGRLVSPLSMWMTAKKAPARPIAATWRTNAGECHRSGNSKLQEPLRTVRSTDTLKRATTHYRRVQLVSSLLIP
jgi:hypothetical protein